MPMTEIGIDVQTMSVARKSRRKRKMTRMTRIDPSIACSLTESIARPMNTDWSSSIVSLMPGISRLIRSTSSLTASAIWTVFSPDCLVTRRRTPGLPLIRVNDRKSSVASSTSAMSFM